MISIIRARQHLLTIVTLFLVLLGCSGSGMAEFKEGQHYFKVNNPSPGEGEKVEVLEFFNYGCPHCNNLEPHVKEWNENNKPDYVTFEHVPSFWNPLFEKTAQAFYTAEALGVIDTMHQQLFDALHVKRVDFNDVNNIRSVFVQNGVEGADFDKQFKSFFVNQKMSIAAKKFSNYGLKSVPVFVVDGQWRTSVQDAGTPEALFQVVNYLTEKAKANR